ncbi:hypothetical protein N7463_009573 [Penicillium fimorum]|uniref:Uncharacterized protein n=1 Tax=Penicillium fimorum TaxID=1882269 RepID=A0A9W9XQY8_9EURO|nr:hypothetical protein N7463_009573 [Penicillium fimorum]
MNRYQEVLSREFDRYRKMLTHDTDGLAALETSGVAIDENDDCDLDAACEAALLDQTRRSFPQLEVLEPISDNEEEDQETGLEATQHTESGDHDSDDDIAKRGSRAKGKQPQKRPCEVVEEDDDLPEMPVDGSMPGRLRRIRKQPRLPDGFQLDL